MAKFIALVMRLSDKSIRLLINQQHSWQDFDPQPSGLGFAAGNDYALWGDETSGDIFLSLTSNSGVRRFDFDAGTWSTSSISSGGTSRDIHGSSVNNVWALFESALWYWNGVSWTRDLTYPAGTNVCQRIWVSPEESVWCVSRNSVVSTIWQRDPLGNWIDHSVAYNAITDGLSNYDASSQDVFGTSDSDVWIAAGYYHNSYGRTTIVHYNGTNFEIAYNANGNRPAVEAIWANDGHSIGVTGIYQGIGVGQQRAIVITGSTGNWSSEIQSFNQQLSYGTSQTLHGLSENNLMAGGTFTNGGVVYHGVDGSWDYNSTAGRAYDWKVISSVSRDKDPPYLDGYSPSPEETNVLLDEHIEFKVLDAFSGVNPESVEFYINGVKAYENFTQLNNYIVDVSSVDFGYLYDITTDSGLLPDNSSISINVLADDYEGNSLDAYWGFQTIDSPFLQEEPKNPNNRYMIDNPMVWVIRTYSTNVVIDSLAIIDNYGEIDQVEVELISDDVIDISKIQSGSIVHDTNETTVSLISKHPVPWSDVVTMHWVIRYHDDDNPILVENTGSFDSIGTVHYLKIWKEPVVDDIYVIINNTYQQLVYDPRDPSWDGYIDGYWLGSIGGNGTGGLDVTVVSPHNYFPGEYFNWEMYFQEINGVDEYRSGEVYNPPDGVYLSPDQPYSGMDLGFDTDNTVSTPGGTGYVGTITLSTPTRDYLPIINGTLQPGWEGGFYTDGNGQMQFLLNYAAGYFNDLDTADQILWHVVFILGNQVYLEQQGSIYRSPAQQFQNTSLFTTSKEAYFDIQGLREPQGPRLYFISPAAGELTGNRVSTMNISVLGQGKVYRPTVSVYLSSSNRAVKMPIALDGYATNLTNVNAENIQELIDGYDEYGFDFTIDTSNIPFDPYTDITVEVFASDELDEPLFESYTFKVREYEEPRVVDFPENITMNRFGHISFSLTDAQSGVDLSATSIVVGGITAFESGSFSSNFSTSTITPTSDGYDFVLISEQPYPSGQQISFEINPVDNHGN